MLVMLLTATVCVAKLQAFGASPFNAVKHNVKSDAIYFDIVVVAKAVAPVVRLRHLSFSHPFFFGQ